jgi:hypothetical protein
MTSLSQLPPKTHKSNNTSLNLKKGCRKKSIDVTRKNIEKKHKMVKLQITKKMRIIYGDLKPTQKW